MVELKITLKRSVIRRPQNQHATVKTLGLDKVSSTITKPANGAIKSAVNTISHLVDTEEV